MGPPTGPGTGTQPIPTGCPPVMVPAGGTTMGQCNPSQIGQSCTITCPPGYPVVGSGTAVCGSDGTWSPSPPYCMGGPSPGKPYVCVHLYYAEMSSQLF